MFNEPNGLSKQIANDLGRRFDQIRAYMANQLGFEPLDFVTSEQSDDLTQMAEEAVALWDEAIVASEGKLHPRGELQLLLACYPMTVELCFLIMGRTVRRAECPNGGQV